MTRAHNPSPPCRGSARWSCACAVNSKLEWSGDIRMIKANAVHTAAFKADTFPPMSRRFSGVSTLRSPASLQYTSRNDSLTAMGVEFQRVRFTRIVKEHKSIMYISQKCYMGFCTPRRTIMDSKKKKKKKNPREVSHYLLEASRGAYAIVSQNRRRRVINQGKEHTRRSEMKPEKSNDS
jgi:hypothetical protein